MTKKIDYNKAEFEVDNDNTECSFCSFINEIIYELMESKEDEWFEILHDAMDFMYNSGYTESLRVNARAMLEIADQIDNEE
jgi:hypothetical protein